MKKLVIIASFIYLVFDLFAQDITSVYYDAMFLKDSCYSQEDQKFYRKQNLDAIFSKYFPNEAVDINNATFKSVLRQNPFLAIYIPDGTVRTTDDKLSLSGFSLSSIGGIEIPNNILLGVTDFIIKRTKQELSIAFFDKFKTLLCDSNYIDLQTVFPQTYKNLLTIGDRIYQYEAYIQSLRESFRKDIDNLDDNLPTIIDNHPAFWKKHAEWKASLQSAFYLSDALSDKTHPGDILNEYPAEYLDSLNINWKGALQTLQLISASLRDTSHNEQSAYWVSPRQVRELVTDDVAFRIYLGLIYQQVKTKADPIRFKTSTIESQHLSRVLDTVAVHYQQYSAAYGSFITHVSEKTNKISSLIHNNKIEARDDSIAIQQYYTYFTATLNLLEQCTEISTLPYIKDFLPNLADSLKGYFDIAHSTADLVMDIKLKSYSSAITDAAHIYDLVKANQAEKDKALAGPQSKRKRDEDKVRDEGSPMTNEIIETRDHLFKFGSFMAAMATAKSPEDVEKAIEAVALPTGSSRVKRETSSNIALNAYTGLFAGNEVIKGVDPDKLLAEFNSFGLTVPIGISFSKGHRFLPWPLSELNCFETKAGWSSTLFISLVDLGAVAAYRVANDTVDQVPTIQLEDIFSPGLFWSVGVPKTPISVNLGVQVGPNLRKVNSEMNDYSNNTYIRFSASVCVDLPILNLYTKSR